MWNEELLGVGGYLARTAYEQEMSAIASLWPTSTPASPSANDELCMILRARALHALKFFTFHASTPAAQVSALLEDAFFSCTSAPTSFAPFARMMLGDTPPVASNAFTVISTVGIKPASDVRMPNAVFSEFLKTLPVLPPEVIEGAKVMVATLQQRDMIKDITFKDVLAELRARPLAEVRFLVYAELAMRLTRMHRCNLGGNDFLFQVVDRPPQVRYPQADRTRAPRANQCRHTHVGHTWYR